MRWIPPGQFLMGSPRDETGRYENEVQHHVTLSTGFWMFDTPCTQRLWMAVMEGDNPSRFSDPLRPMEQVEWKQATEFATKLAAKIPELCFRLPTEAQWEYACRAGTSTPIYSGSLEILGDANAPALDPIAWYGGNSGHEFDREDGVDITSYLWLSSKQYEFSVAGTRPVKQKRPNPWGLYDMLGNVWEWCSGEGDIRSSRPSHVSRGGCWSSGAALCRMAFRNTNDPADRRNDRGFRLAL
ncbi:MAG TPA: formylglycine-generating enzyme family protein, partial [Planctomycetaceae bacterium]|nr:formylglycine-generating enzyme family protein [Planctomycetaceae bacterium]